MIHRVHRDEYEGMTTGLEIPVRGDSVNGHRHGVPDVEAELKDLKRTVAHLSTAVERIDNALSEGGNEDKAST